MKRAPFFGLAITSVIMLGSLSLHAAGIKAEDAWPEVSQLPVQATLPDPLIMFDGARVATKKQWLNQRRPELKKLFEHYMCGKAPPPPAKLEFIVERVDKKFLGGKATKKEVTIVLGTDKAPQIHLLLVVPNQRKRPAPVFVGVNFTGNHTLVSDPTVRLPTSWMYDWQTGVTNNRASEAGRGTQVDVWAVEQSIDRGYAVATFYSGDLEPDKADTTDGVRNYYANAGENFD